MNSTEGIFIDTNQSFQENLTALGIQESEEQVLSEFVNHATDMIQGSIAGKNMMGGKRRNMKGGRSEKDCREAAIANVLTLVASGVVTTGLGASYLALSQNLCAVHGLQGLALYVADKYSGVCTSAQTAFTTGMTQIATALASLGVVIKSGGKVFVPEAFIKMAMKFIDGCNPPTPTQGQSQASTNTVTNIPRNKKTKGGKRNMTRKRTTRRR